MRPKGKLKDWFFARWLKSGCAVFRVRGAMMAQADPIKPKGRLSEESEIIEKRVDCAEVPQVESFGYK